MNENISFDDLPDLALIQVKSLIDYKVVPYSVTSIWRFVRKGQFPAPIKVSDGITAWRVGDIRKYLLDINNRPQEDSPKVAERKKSVAQSRRKKMTESRYLDPEDEAFNEIERQAKQRKEAVQAAMRAAMASDLYDSGYKDGMNDTIEEVAQHIEKMTGFGQDTISSFAIYIRGMKR